MSRRYWCFLSYSHKDEAEARWLARAIEGFRVPRPLIGHAGRDEPVQRYIRPVFRDRDELPASADLGATLREALAASGVLVVLCSPDSARSRWVEEEILSFKQSGRADRILGVIVRGRPDAKSADEQCFPPALRHALRADGSLNTDISLEPIAADLTMESRQTVLLRVIAGVLGIAFDDLKQRHRTRQKIRNAVAGCMVAALLAAFAGMWWWQETRSEVKLAESKKKSDAVLRVERTIARQNLTVEEAKRWAEQGREHLLRQENQQAAAFLDDAAAKLENDQDVQLMRSLALSSFRGQLMALTGLDDPITHVAWSADGRLIAAGDKGGHLCWWDAVSGTKAGEKTISPLRHEPMSVLAISADSSAIVAGCGVERSGLGGLAIIPTSASGAEPLMLEKTASVSSLALSPAGDAFAATLTPDGYPETATVGVWSLPDGKPLVKLNQGKNGLRCVFLPDGKRLASAADDHTVVIWDWRAKKELARLAAPQHIHALVIDEPAQHILAAGRDVILRGWNLADFKQIMDAPLPEPMKFDPVVTFSPAHSRMLFSYMNETLALEVSVPAGGTKRPQRKLPLPWGFYMTRAALSPNARHVAVCGSKGEMHVFDAESGDWFGATNGHEMAATALAWSPDGSRIATGGTDRRVIVWDWRRTQSSPPARTDSQKYPAKTAEWCGASREHIVRTATLETGIFDLRGHELHRLNHQVNDSYFDGGGTEMAVSKDGRLIATGRLDDTIRIWDAETGAEKRVIKLNKTIAWGIDFSPDGRFLAAADRSGKMLCWDLQTAEDTPKWHHEKMSARTPVFSPDGRSVAVTALSGEPGQMLNAGDGTTRFVIPPGEGDKLEVRFLTDPALMVIYGIDPFCRVVSTLDGKELTKIGPHAAPVELAATSPDGKLLITEDSSGRMRFWSLPDGTSLGQWQEPDRASLRAAAFSPGGDFIAVGTSTAVYIVSSRQRVALARFAMPNTVSSVRFHPSGAHLLFTCGLETRQITLSFSSEIIQELGARAAELNAYVLRNGTLVPRHDPLTGMR